MSFGDSHKNDVRFSVEEQAEEIHRRFYYDLEQTKEGLWRLLTLEWVKSDKNEHLDIAIDLKEGTTREEAEKLCELLNERMCSLTVTRAK